MTLVKGALVALAVAVFNAAIIHVGGKDSELSPDQQLAESVFAAAIT